MSETRFCPHCRKELPPDDSGEPSFFCEVVKGRLEAMGAPQPVPARSHLNAILRRNLDQLVWGLVLCTLFVLFLFVLSYLHEDPVTTTFHIFLLSIFGFGSVAVILLYLRRCAKEALEQARLEARKQWERRIGEALKPDLDLLRADAKACARNGLLSGCPAYLFWYGWGAYLAGLEEEFGLPVMLQGDVVEEPESSRIAGHNAGIRETIQEYGLPWNSRKPWLKEVWHPKEYFLEHSKSVAPCLLQAGGAPATSSDGTTVVSLEAAPDPKRPELLNLSLRVTSRKLWLGKSFISPTDYWKFKSPPAQSGEALKTLPRLELPEPATRSIGLTTLERGDVNRDERAKVELVFGPTGSELAFVRYHTLKVTLAVDQQHEEIVEALGVLDLQLLEWVAQV